jgi:hypothetical protein
MQYDVAISFLSSDVGVARDLRDRLAPQLRVFLYWHRQEDVSGLDEVFFLVRILLILPGENRYYRREPEVLAERRYAPQRSRARKVAASVIRE